MTPKAVLNQKGGQAAAAPAFRQGLLFEAVHHAAWQGDIQPFRIRCLRNIRSRDSSRLPLQLCLELIQQILQN